MGRRIGLVLVCAAVLATVAAGCGGESEGAAKECGTAPAAMSGTPTLPTGFPSPSEVVYTGQSKEGPTTKVEGYWKGDLDAAFEGYKDAFGSASGYSVTKSEHEEDDAEVNFEGHGTTGQVALKVDCKDRTAVTITIRPA